jgi:hypothetical protein
MYTVDGKTHQMAKERIKAVMWPNKTKFERVNTTNRSIPQFIWRDILIATLNKFMILTEALAASLAEHHRPKLSLLGPLAATLAVRRQFAFHQTQLIAAPLLCQR